MAKKNNFVHANSMMKNLINAVVRLQQTQVIHPNHQYRIPQNYKVIVEVFEKKSIIKNINEVCYRRCLRET